MPNPTEYEFNMEAAQSTENMTLGDHVVQEGYESQGDKTILDLISANEKLVNKYAEQICNHFSSVLGGLPESMQQAYIDSIRNMNGDHDLVYKGMVARFDNRLATSNSNA